MSSGSFKNNVTYKLFAYKPYMYEQETALDNPQELIFHNIQPGARGVMVIVSGIGHGDTSSNPGLIAFHIALIPLGKVWIQLFSLQLWVNSRAG